jgi:hypothetical protein
VTAFAGYRFRPSRYTPALGHAGLDVLLTERAGRSSFYIRSATFKVVASRVADHTFRDIRSDNGRFLSNRVAIGCLKLIANNNDAVCGFSFGGRLDIEDEGDFTVCRLQSPAPVFELFNESETLSVFIFSELQTQLARQRARWGRDDLGFERCLLAIDPFRLFVAGLSSLKVHLARLVRGGDEYRAGLRWVNRAIETLDSCGEWTEPAPLLTDIIC